MTEGQCLLVNGKLGRVFILWQTLPLRGQVVMAPIRSGASARGRSNPGMAAQVIEGPLSSSSSNSNIYKLCQTCIGNLDIKAYIYYTKKNH